MPTGRAEHLAPSDDGAAEALLVTVREVVADLHPGHAVPVGLGSRLEADLGLDSLSVAELLVRTEDLFGVSIPEETLVAARTPRDLLTAAAAVSGRGHGGVDAAGLTHLRMSSGLVATADLAGVPPDEVVVPPPGTVPETASGRIGRATAGERHGPGATLYGVWALAAFGIVAAVTGLLVALAPTLRLRWRLVQGAGRLLTVLTGVRVDVEDARHLPRDRPFVVVANHASHVDPLVLAMLLQEPAVFAAVADLADNPLLRIGLRRMHVHLVERGDRARGVADARSLTETVRAGRTVVFFPEGRRAPTSGLETFKTGAFLVAAQTGAPVVPVALQGTRTVFPVGRRLPRRATVRVTVGPPVTTQQAGWRGAIELQREARRVILRHCGEPDLA